MGDSTGTKTRTLSRNPVELQRVGSRPKTFIRASHRHGLAEDTIGGRSNADLVPHKHVQACLWYPYGGPGDLPECGRTPRVDHRAAIVDCSCSWCTEATRCWKFMDARSLMKLSSTFVSMVYGPTFSRNGISPVVIRHGNRSAYASLPLQSRPISPSVTLWSHGVRRPKIFSIHSLCKVRNTRTYGDVPRPRPPLIAAEADGCSPATLGAGPRVFHHHTASEGVRPTFGGYGIYYHQVL